RLCDDRLHCLCWDDAQAMDPATVELLVSIIGRAHDSVPAPKPGGTVPPPSMVAPLGLRAVFILATRAAPPDGLTRSAALHRITPGELSDDDVARLISTRVGARILAPELLAFCRERAGGHPLFLEELLRELIDSGAVNVVGGEAKAKLEGA